MFDIEKEFNTLNEDSNLDSLLAELDKTLVEDTEVVPEEVEEDLELKEAFEQLDSLLEETEEEEEEVIEESVEDVDIELQEACDQLDALVEDTDLADELDSLLEDVENVLTEGKITMEDRKARHAKYRAKMEAKIEKCTNVKKLEKMAARCDKNIAIFEEAMKGLKADPVKYADDIEDLKIGIKDEKALKAKIQSKLKTLKEGTEMDNELDMQLEEAFSDLDALLEEAESEEKEIDVDSILESAYEDEDDDEEVFTEASNTYTVKYDKNTKKKRLISQCELLACKEENPTLFAKYKVARKKSKELRLQIKKQFRSKGIAKYKALVKAKKQIPDK